jgi:putative ABC transport system permease protein
MKFLPLILANLGRHKLRNVLTVLSVAAAMFLFASLRTFETTLDSLTDAGSDTRMVVRNATGLVFSLPMSYAQRLAAVPGVETVCWAAWFGGWYRDEREFFANFAVDAPSMLEIYPEIIVPPDQKEAFLRERTGAIVGVDLMAKYGWQLGQNITLNGTIYPGQWTFTIRATYTAQEGSAFDEMSLMFHYDYLYENTNRQAMPGWFYLKLRDAASATQVAAAVDAQFKNSRAATRTETERAFQAGWMSMFGNVKFLMTTIGIAVVFAILLITGNAMMMSARERTGEIAVLKTLGFGAGLLFRLELSEAVAIALLGSAMGLGGATLLWANVDFLQQFLPGFTVAPSTLVVGAGIALALALASGFVPAFRAYRLPAVTAMRAVE